MTEYHVTTTRTSPLDLVGGDTVLISTTGSIDVAGTCISSLGSGNFVYVDGSVRNSSASGAAIKLSVGNVRVTQASSLVWGRDCAISINGTIENKGRIEGGNCGVENFGLGMITNDGLIVGGQYGVKSISTRQGSGLDVRNAGTIKGSVAAVQGGNNSDFVVNTGHLSGHYAVSLGAGDDELHTSYKGQGTVSGIIDMGEGDDEVYGGLSDETVYGGGGEDILRGAAGDDLLYGGAEDDSLEGGSGNDILSGGEGADRIDGGEGIDVISYSHLTTGLVYDVLNGLLSGGEADGEDEIFSIEGVIGSQASDTLTGSDAVNILRGSDGNDFLEGRGGHDTLSGDAGVDTVNGGAGDDVIFVDDARDVVHEGIGEGRDTVTSGVSYALSPTTFVEILRASGSANVTLTGNKYDNTIVGNSGRNVLKGGNGHDTLMGGHGNDKLIGGYGKDVLTGGAGRDTLSGGGGSDKFVFNVKSGAADKIVGFNYRHDSLQLENSIFKKLGRAGKLNDDFFKLGRPTEKNDYLYYDKGKLFYDGNGSDAGGSVLIATFGSKTKLFASDIMII